MNGVLTEELAMSAHFSFYFIGWGLINNYKLHVYTFVYFVYLYIYSVFNFLFIFNICLIFGVNTILSTFCILFIYFFAIYLFSCRWFLEHTSRQLCLSMWFLFDLNAHALLTNISSSCEGRGERTTINGKLITDFQSAFSKKLASGCVGVWLGSNQRS